MSVITLKKPVRIISSASVVGRHEHAGPLGGLFDFWDADDAFGMDTWEHAEAEMQRMALTFALNKYGADDRAIDAVFAGDLMNQCTSSSYGLLPFDIPYFGLYGACSTAVEGILLASLLIDGGHFSRIASVVSSHNCTAERQYRTPIEYGSLRAQTSQWTVTGAGAVILADGGDGAKVEKLLPGRTFDLGINDPADMGAAMAPAAADTLSRYFRETGTLPRDVGKIVTGDLGFRGYEMMVELMHREGYDVTNNYTDCGMLIYNREKADVHSGGSGCGCSAVVFASHFLRELNEGRLDSMLLIGTGALMSPLTVAQGDSIPAVAHLAKVVR
ncbi:MAG: stage V sporulation protein AD [Clostridia bacterium]|nr:stage V sporulation protein AD [Clostridia bacterium]